MFQPNETDEEIEKRLAIESVINKLRRSLPETMSDCELLKNWSCWKNYQDYDLVKFFSNYTRQILSNRDDFPCLLNLWFATPIERLKTLIYERILALMASGLRISKEQSPFLAKIILAQKWFKN